MKKRLALGLLAATAIVGAAMIAPVVLAQQPSADLILTNGKIITVDDRFSIAQAIAVRGDRIIAVGTTADITKLAGPQTRRVDLRGKSVVPGFIDNHAHFQEEGAYWTWSCASTASTRASARSS
jgi:predicted amidohydrolase YtcJ